MNSGSILTTGCRKLGHWDCGSSLHWDGCKLKFHPSTGVVVSGVFLLGPVFILQGAFWIFRIVRRGGEEGGGRKSLTECVQGSFGRWELASDSTRSYVKWTSECLSTTRDALRSCHTRFILLCWDSVAHHFTSNDKPQFREGHIDGVFLLAVRVNEEWPLSSIVQEYSSDSISGRPYLQHFHHEIPQTHVELLLRLHCGLLRCLSRRLGTRCERPHSNWWTMWVHLLFCWTDCVISNILISSGDKTLIWWRNRDLLAFFPCGSAVLSELFHFVGRIGQIACPCDRVASTMEGHPDTPPSWSERPQFQGVRIRHFRGQ